MTIRTKIDLTRESVISTGTTAGLASSLNEGDTVIVKDKTTKQINFAKKHNGVVTETPLTSNNIDNITIPATPTFNPLYPLDNYAYALALVRYGSDAVKLKWVSVKTYEDQYTDVAANYNPQPS